MRVSPLAMLTFDFDATEHMMPDGKGKIKWLVSEG
jgi:hypothetical protein